MAFWKTLGKVTSAIVEIGANSVAESQRKVGNRIQEYERKLSNAESSDKMNNPEYARKVNENRQKFETAKQKVYTNQSSTNKSVNKNHNGETTIGNKTIAEWDSKWRGLGLLGSLSLSDLSAYNQSIGLYKAEMGGKIYYIGRAIEYNNGGFRKRLRDYVRESDSARTHKSGGKMNENADRIYISILVMGHSQEEVDAVKALESALVVKYLPEWNVQFKKL
ncbi:hypothetical protein FHS15_001438 [Paenibacillus castaneae]|uniref:hypothetical protein n=1 Tax=Paenibacillus castaneae TaxID=474957 RepID=UPI000C9A17FC|nr:hypothetical protein [Paenibacillus castaneae]NIK76331.1 hypothetical protein [Paenibacillus castaneae]